MPFSELDEEALDAVWNGLKEPVTVIMKYGKRERKFQSRWDGVIKVLRKKFEQTESEWVRGDLQRLAHRRGRGELFLCKGLSRTRMPIRRSH